jgi:hypothetical protein
MLQPNRFKRLSLFAFIIILVASAPTFSQKKESKKKAAEGAPVLWQEPSDIESRNLLLGAGGEQMKPALEKVTYLEDKKGGYSTKYRVRDAAGNEWIAKIGKEAQPDTAANRLVWAVGYVTEIAYLVPRLTIEGKGTFDNVRLEARPKNVERVGDWSWEDNPFKGTPQLQGLKILMVMINNWDMKDENNQTLAMSNEATGARELRYIISDLGGSFGKTGGIISRSRNKPSDYVKAKLIESVKGNRIDFNYGGKNKKLFENITIEDAHWLAALLTRLSEDQIRDAFRAANYGPAEVEALSGAFRARVNELSGVSREVATRP